MDRGPGTTSPVRVLVADDSLALRALVRITLTSQGWSMIEAETAQYAIAKTRETRPDLVILDIDFGGPGPDGLAACRELKSDPATASIPIVILTAHDNVLERERAKDAKADAFIAKPFGPIDLLTVVRELAPAPLRTPSLGVYLLDAGAVEPVALEAALAEQRELMARGRPKRLGELLLERGSVTQAALDRALLEQLNARASADSARVTRVLVIDDHLAVREGLRALINGEDGLQVVGEAADADEGMRLARRHRPDVVVLDNEMPGRSGLDLLPTLRAEVPSAKLVMFSLDPTAQSRALGQGAHAFISKDSPMDQILSAIRPIQETPTMKDAADSLVPLFRSDLEPRRAATVIGVTLVAYAILFFLLERPFGAAAGTFSVLPALAVGLLLGPEGGLIGAALVLITTFALWTVTGHTFGEPVLSIGVPGFGIVVLLVLGFAAGAMRVLGVRLDPKRRRVEAIAEAARTLTGISRGEFIDAFLAAMLEVGSGDVVLLYANAAGEARLLSSSEPIRGTDALSRLARDVMRTATPRVVDELSAGERAISTMRSAVLVPISVAGQDVRGVLVALARAPGLFSDASIAQIRPFAQTLWIVMRGGPFSPELPSTRAASGRTTRPAGRRSQPRA